jgi:hypothetical protein
MKKMTGLLLIILIGRLLRIGNVVTGWYYGENLRPCRAGERPYMNQGFFIFI